MVETWFLVIVIGWPGSSVTSQTIPQKSPAACEVARVQAEAVVVAKHTGYAFCVTGAR